MAVTMSMCKSLSVNLFGLLRVRTSYISSRLASSTQSSSSSSSSFPVLSIRIRGGKSISTWSQQKLWDEKGNFFSNFCSKYTNITSTSSDANGNGDRDGKEKGYLELTDQELMRQCQLETFKASGPGGQHRNKRESAVRLKHLPTGLIAQAVEDRSQHMNRASALARLRTILALKGTLWILMLIHLHESSFKFFRRSLPFEDQILGPKLDQKILNLFWECKPCWI